MKELCPGDLVESLNICRCGNPIVCYDWLIEYLTDLDEQNWGKYDYESPEWKYIQIINAYLDEKDFVDHGITCRCSWLTDDGKRLLETLRTIKKNGYNFDPDANTEYGKWFWEGKASKEEDK